MNLTEKNNARQQEPCHNGTSAQNKNLLLNLKALVQKFKLLVQLQIDGRRLQREIGCMSQMNTVLIQNLVEAFKCIRQEKQEKNGKSIQSQIDYCNNTIQLFEIKIIETVETLMNHKQNQKENIETAQQLYQQFYIACSEYMNESYKHSNNLCLLLSQEVHSLSPNHKSVPEPNPTSKITHSADYFLLKHLFEKICQAKKVYEEEVQAYEKELAQLRKEAEESKSLIANIKNSREEMAEDLNQLEEAVETGSIEAVKQIIHRINIPKTEYDGVWKSKDLNVKDKVHIAKQNSNVEELQAEILGLRHENEQLIVKIQSLNEKLKEYKNEIYRAGWIISVQNRQISLNLQKIKQKEAANSRFSPNSSGISFKPVQNRIQMPSKLIKWPSPQSMFTKVEFR